MNIKNETFYMIYVENMNNPVFVHTTFESAEKEAERLCKKMNAPTFILRAVRKIELNEFIKTDLIQDDGLPF